ncbi:transglutaminase domain protein [Treponema primitia ZAS-2]|uniref:Transglutaminase domain protein n=1 Tax=Treponema primitia (strain ATCC BAA-887 / DSM 12427 / ZAS-2) TaxID=545694 RepID=F5YQS0_TREPZ|nr:transglutaminase-like domain-containing protein [Treponema primitia]AEF86596.1 transglutaminase domain protein [Treponema primitia ZAS-2]
MAIDLSFQSVPLPEDLQKLKFYGDFSGAEKLITFLLNKKIPEALRRRLEIERAVLECMSLDEYPYTFEEASAMMQERIRDYSEGELTGLKETGLADWIFIDGKVRFQRRFFENLTKTRPEYESRLLKREPQEITARKQQVLNDNVRLMKEKGGRTVEITLRTSIKIKKEFEEIGKEVTVHLPLPRECRQVSGFSLLKTTPEGASIAPPEAPQRTACFKTILKGDDRFSLEYRFLNHLDYINPDPGQAVQTGVSFDLGEQLPHIQFTPYLQFLLKEIVGDEKNPVNTARRIYDFITTTVDYSYMRAYFTIDNISQYAAVNLKGDCGVQAILFITLCRMAGIPARWQSGLFTAEYYTGCHDWAEYYIEPWGWIFADLSFGGSSWRAGETERWNYYFSNLDVFRMPANGSMQDDFTPPKKQLRSDPVDNQRGEIEYGDRGLPMASLETEQVLLSIRDV